MRSNTDVVVMLVAAFLILFSTMWEPLVSATVCIIALAGFTIYELATRNR
jgi:hypothetical protein